MDQTDCYWLSVLRDAKWSQRVWGRLVNILQIEEADIKVLAVLYREVVHAVILFILESSVLSSSMEKW